MRLEQPLSDPVVIVAVAMTVFLLAPLLFERLRVPGIIGVLLSGALLGPHALNLLARDPTIILLGTVGLLYLVFLAALELDFHRFTEYRRRSMVFGLLSFGIPMVLATIVMPLIGYGLAASLLWGSIIGSHTLLAYPAVSRLGLAKNLSVTTVVGGSLITDTFALAVLALVAASYGDGLSVSFIAQLLTGLAVFATIVVLGVPRLARWFFRNVAGQSQAEFIFLMVVLFATAYFASVAGAQPIIGAYLAGLALNSLIPQSSPLMNRVRFIGNSLFVPFFLLSVGMLMDFSVLASSAEVWIVALLIIVLVNVGKFAGAWITRGVFGYTGAEGWMMFGLSVPQAAATLAVTFVGLEIGLFDETAVNAVIIMILMTGIVGPMVVERMGRRVAASDERQPRTRADVPRRIVIPMANPTTAESLMDLAFIFRDPRSAEAIYPLMVVTDDARAEAEVAEAEKMLGHAVVYGAGADVPVIPLTRVDRNIASGVARGITETGGNVVIVGWDGRAASRMSIFGSVLDQLLTRTKQLVLVAKLGHPLNTTGRIILVLPPRSRSHPGFLDAVADVKIMANLLGASIYAISFNSDEVDYAETLREVGPEAPISAKSVTGWSRLLTKLNRIVKSTDLIVVLSGRHGGVNWHPKLERLPGILAGLLPQSFLMIYPPEADTSPRESVLESFPGELSPRRVAADLPPTGFEVALRRLLMLEFDRGDPRVAEITERLIAAEHEFSTEIRPGVVVPHVLVDGLPEPILFLGMSTTGIEFPNARDRAKLIFLLLSPLGRPQEHLNVLADIARMVSRTENLDELVDWVIASADIEAAGSQ